MNEMKELVELDGEDAPESGTRSRRTASSSRRRRTDFSDKYLSKILKVSEKDIRKTAQRAWNPRGVACRSSLWREGRELLLFDVQRRGQIRRRRRTPRR
ncbi:hypothetical protein [Treponema saccharophilum]|uniref:hypothetical protein n=1 Tax=Treponema saccharophilum TaxID=165 RepID=UPI003CCAC119